MYITDETLVKMKEIDAIKLSRPERRRREKLMQKFNKQKKLGISVVDNSESDTITVSKTELQRMVEANVVAKMESIQSWRDRAFKKMTYEMFYIICYVMYKYYGFGPKRMTQFCSYMFETYFDCYMDLDNGLDKSKFEQMRSELNEKFKIDFLKTEYDECGNVSAQSIIDEQKIHDSIRGTWA